MRILIHDFAGHPFQIQLSRELATREHHITHAYAAGLPGPKGRLDKSSSDPEHFRVRPIQLSKGFRKYSAHRRFAAHRQYARDLCAVLSQEKPDVLLSGNTPIDLQAELLWYCRRNRIGFVHWVQDVYCQAIEFFLQTKLPLLSRALSSPFRILEKAVARHSESTIVISPGFCNLLLDWGIPESNLTVLENWGILDEVKPMPRRNAWSDAHGLQEKTAFLYSGTLGLKHRPDLLYRLADSLGDDCRVVVISEGVGRAYLEQQPRLKNLLLLDFQPYDRIPEVLASADVLVATLEFGAGEFAVPSKVLSYLCVGRPLLLAAPASNLAANIVQRSGSGIVVDPRDDSAWIIAANKLASESEYRSRLGLSAREYAEREFDIRKIATSFESVLIRSCYSNRPAAANPLFVPGA